MKQLVTLDKYYNPLYEGDYVITKHGRVCKIIWSRNSSHIGYDFEPLHTAYPPPDEYDKWNPHNLIKLNNVLELNEQCIAEIIKKENIK